MYKAFLIALVAIGLTGCSNRLPGQKQQAAGCAIALDYTTRFLDETSNYHTKSGSSDGPTPLAVRRAPYALLPVITDEGPIEGTLPSSFREVEDWRDILKMSDLSVIENCPKLEARLADRNVLTDDEKIDDLTRKDDWGIYLLRLAMPIITDDGKGAAIFASKRSSGTSGVSVVAIYVKNESGKWSLSKQEVRAIS